MKLCSACLLGVKCRYDGDSKANEAVIQLSQREVLVPICPEQLGGLPTPRKAAEQQGDRVVTVDGEDVTAYFAEGARQVLEMARLYDVKSVILKQRSPSCGCGKVYDGTFSGTLTEGDGVTAKLLKENGIGVVSEEDLSH